MSTLTNDRWTARVNEVRQLASDLHSMKTTVADYGGDRTAYIDAMMDLAVNNWDVTGYVGISDPDEQRILRSELERIVEE